MKALITALFLISTAASASCDFSQLPQAKVQKSPLFRANSSDEAIALCENAGWFSCEVESYRGNFPCFTIMGGPQCSSWTYSIRGSRVVALSESEKRQATCNQVRECRRELRTLSGDERRLARQQADEVASVHDCR